MLKSLLREPLIHFLLLGGLLFGLYGLKNEGLYTDKNRIFISATDIKSINTLWHEKWQRLPTPTELQGLIDQQIHEEIMYREALLMGMGYNDPVVRRRLAQKMEFVSSDLAQQLEPTDAELSAYLNSHSDKFEMPARLSFEQIYLSVDQRGSDAKQDALQLLNELKQLDSTANIKNTGDTFMFGQQQNNLSEHDIARIFGNDFAIKLFSLTLNSWQGPILSGYGFHLVRINSKTIAEMPSLNTVQKKVRDEWVATQRESINKAFYNSLRQRYQIVIEDVTNTQGNISAN